MSGWSAAARATDSSTAQWWANTSPRRSRAALQPNRDFRSLQRPAKQNAQCISISSPATVRSGLFGLRSIMRVLLILCSLVCLFAQTTRIVSGRRYPRLIVRNALIIEGNGTPTSGPKDIVIENGRIVDIVALDPVALSRGTSRRPLGDAEIDAKGKYVMPGLINAHAHIQDERGGIPQPV